MFDVSILPSQDQINFIYEAYYGNGFFPNKNPRKEHGIHHLVRAMLYGAGCLYLLEKYQHPLSEIYKKNPDLRKYVLLALALHDSGRLDDKEDLWDKESGSNVYNYLISLKVDPKTALLVAEAMANKDYKRKSFYDKASLDKDNQLIWQTIDSTKVEISDTIKALSLVIQGGDCIDMFRLVNSFEVKYLDIYQEFTSMKHKSAINELEDLLSEAASIAYMQGEGLYKNPSTAPQLNQAYSVNTLIQTQKLIETHYPTLGQIYSSESKKERKEPKDPIIAQFYSDGIYCRGVAAPSAINLPAKDKYPEENKVEIELRKINRNNEKIGNPNRSIHLVMRHSRFYVASGYIYSKDLKIIKASKTDTNTGRAKKLHLYPDPPETIADRINEVKSDLRKGNVGTSHSELIADSLRSEQIKAVYYTEDPTCYDGSMRVNQQSYGYSASKHTPKLEAVFLSQAKNNNFPIYQVSGIHNTIEEVEFSEEELFKIWQEAIANYLSFENVRELDNNPEQIKVMAFYWQDGSKVDSREKIKPLDKYYSKELKKKINNVIDEAKKNLIKQCQGKLKNYDYKTLPTDDQMRAIEIMAALDAVNDLNKKSIQKLAQNYIKTSKDPFKRNYEVQEKDPAKILTLAKIMGLSEELFDLISVKMRAEDFTHTYYADILTDLIKTTIPCLKNHKQFVSLFQEKLLSFIKKIENAIQLEKGEKYLIPDYQHELALYKSSIDIYEQHIGPHTQVKEIVDAESSLIQTFRNRQSLFSSFLKAPETAYYGAYFFRMYIDFAVYLKSSPQDIEAIVQTFIKANSGRINAALWKKMAEQLGNSALEFKLQFFEAYIENVRFRTGLDINFSNYSDPIPPDLIIEGIAEMIELLFAKEVGVNKRIEALVFKSENIYKQLFENIEQSWSYNYSNFLKSLQHHPGINLVKICEFFLPKLENYLQSEKRPLLVQRTKAELISLYKSKILELDEKTQRDIEEIVPECKPIDVEQFKFLQQSKQVTENYIQQCQQFNKEWSKMENKWDELKPYYNKYNPSHQPDFKIFIEPLKDKIDDIASKLKLLSAVKLELNSEQNQKIEEIKVKDLPLDKLTAIIIEISTAIENCKKTEKLLAEKSDKIASAKFQGSNSSGIKEVIKIINANLSPLEKLQNLHRIGKEKTKRGFSNWYSHSHFFGKGRHANMDQLYKKFAALDETKEYLAADKLDEIVQFIENNNFVHNPELVTLKI